jgi:hypothetical protein
MSALMLRMRALRKAKEWVLFLGHGEGRKISEDVNVSMGRGRIAHLLSQQLCLIFVKVRTL